MEDIKKKKYNHLAMQFSLYILGILAVFFVLLCIFILNCQRLIRWELLVLLPGLNKGVIIFFRGRSDDIKSAVVENAGKRF